MQMQIVQEYYKTKILQLQIVMLTMVSMLKQMKNGIQMLMVKINGIQMLKLQEQQNSPQTEMVFIMM